MILDILFKKNALKKNICYVLIVCLCTISSFAQKSNSLDTDYSNYFTYSRIIPYLHLNKTSFIKGEEVWFKSYILNQQTNKIDTTTTNLYCIIYDKDGIQKKKKLLRVKNGVAHGSFKIDSTFTQKSYYIKATTNWMKNFKEDHSYVQKITIVNNNDNNTHLAQVKKNKTQISLLPEGGHLVESTDNSLGIIVKDLNRKGVKIKNGAILNQHNKIVKEFSTTPFGHGKVNFFFNKEDNYHVKIELNDGTYLTKPLPKAKKIGIALKVVNTNTPFIQISLNTNTKTLAESSQKKFTLLIHNTRDYYKKTIELNNKNTKYTYFIPTTKIKKGVNVVTIFNDNKTPIAERIIFNYKKNLTSSLNISKEAVHKDSMSILIKKQNPNSHFISASVLPSSSISNLNKSSILFNFLFKPYIRGNVENPNYFFKKTTRKKLLELDLLLLTQGWSKYDWKNIFTKQTPLKHKIEQGITIKGTINTEIISSHATLVSNSNNIFRMEPVLNKKFKIENLFLSENSEFQLAFNQKKKLKKSNAYLQFFPNNSTSKLRIEKNTNTYRESTTEINYKDFIKDAEILDIVDIEGIKKQKEDNDLMMQTAFMRSYDMQKRLNNHNESFFDFLREKRFSVNTNQSTITIKSGSLSPSSSRRYVSVFLDGFDITLGLGLLEGRYTDEFSKVYINKFSIQILSNSLKSHNKNSKFTTTKVPFGFHVAKEYYNPEYISKTNKLFKDYGAVYWMPNITLSKTFTTLKIPLLKQKEVKIIIEGITTDGSIISEEKTIKKGEKNKI